MLRYNVKNLTELKSFKRLDAEYYQSVYFEIFDKLEKADAIPLKSLVIPIKRKFIPIEGQYFKYIEIGKVDLNTGEYEISEILGENAPSRAQYRVKKNDILISTVRPLRNQIVLVERDDENLVCTNGFCVLRPENINKYYLFAFLKTPIVANFLHRYTTATEYPAVRWEDILEIPIYLGNKSFRQNISIRIKNYFKLLQKSQKSYYEAENLLVKELKLDKFKIKYDITYEGNLLSLFKANRIDAEYFQPLYKRFLNHLKSKFIIKSLEYFLSGDLKKGIEIGASKYKEDGKFFFRVSNLTELGFVFKDQKFMEDELYQELKNDYNPLVGELLLTKDANPGIAFVLKEKTNGIIASGILRLKIDETKINKEYFALCINSLVGKLQIERDGGGSIIKHWRPDQIMELKIPLLDKEFQEKIGKKLIDTFILRTQAKHILNKVLIEIIKTIEGEISESLDFP